MRRTAIVVPVLAALTLSGCSGVWLERAGAAQEEPEVLVAEPCSLFSSSDLSTIFGAEVRAGRSGISRIDDGVVAADSRHCRWGVGGLDASLQIAYAEDFDSGEFACVKPADTEVVDVDLGRRAWWSERTVNGVSVGRMRACGSGSLLDVTIVDTAASSRPQTPARSQAELIVKVALLATDV